MEALRYYKSVRKTKDQKSKKLDTAQDYHPHDLAGLPSMALTGKNSTPFSHFFKLHSIILYCSTKYNIQKDKGAK